jgi:hypothetical protein
LRTNSLRPHDGLQAEFVGIKGKVTLFIGQAKPEAGLDVPATIVNDCTLVPLRYVSESFGAEVKWLPETVSVEIVK